MRGQRPTHHIPRLALSGAGAAALIAVVAVLLLSRGSSAGAPATPQPTTTALPPIASALKITVGAGTYGRPIPAGFLGLSFEFPAIERYAGGDPGAINPVFAQLIRNLAPGQQPSLRIGGDSSDWTWWPVPHMARPPGVRIVLDTRWRAVVSALAQELQARLILGINLEANSLAVARTEARQLTGGIAKTAVQALEPGNEPELYGTWGWYTTPGGRPVPGRPRSYSYADFVSDFARFARVLPQAPLAGPAIGGPTWMRSTGQFLARAPRLGIVTLHRYPLLLCFLAPSDPNYATIAHLLADAASRGLADSVAPYVAMVHRRGLPLRIDEMNTIACGGDDRVGKSFASALWALDALFEMARVGVDGVNIHTYPGATYELFRFTRTGGRWQGLVSPQYYGMLMFARAVPSGARLLRTTPIGGGAVKAWATRAPDGHTRVVLINRSASRARVIALKVTGASTAAALERLAAPGLQARTATLGGHSFGATTTTGQLAPPNSIAVVPVRGYYVVKLAAASAAMLTL
jgi:hypothetical protein